MPATLPPPTKPRPRFKAPKRRAEWRQRLRDSESGVRQGVRSNSSFAVHFFLGTVTATAAFVLNFAIIEWAVLILAFTSVLSAEMFYQLLRILWEQEGRLLSTRSQEALRIGTAAVMVTIGGSLTVSGILFARRIMALWSE